jgi:hypothetical protein
MLLKTSEVLVQKVNRFTLSVKSVQLIEKII